MSQSVSWPIALCLALAAAAVSAQVPVDDPTEQDGVLLERVQVHAGIKAGGVGLVRGLDGNRIIVAVGTAELRSRDPIARREAAREAELDARVRMAAFVKGERVTAMTRSTQKLEVGRDGKPRIEDEFEERISGTVDHDMAGVRLIGTYASADQSRLCAAVIIDETILQAVVPQPDGFPLFPRMVTTRGMARATTDTPADLESALKDAILKAQWSAGGARVQGVLQRGTGQPFRSFEQVQVSGWVDSFSILSEWRDLSHQYIVIQAVVVTDPLRGLGSERAAARRPGAVHQPARMIQTH